ncbi:hypothetical protein [Sandarakinorhabdus sp.]|uniref:DUF2306 domain-containing protein n=1 Tax=Sandarakinorhabdus sp. TaxID=1916663 RepID=UPI00286EA737|nr:hypothetical protein [Sandarakinorhabdus sp.]
MMAAILSNRNLAYATAALLAVVLVAVARGGGGFPALPVLVQIHLASMVFVMALTVPMLLAAKGTPRHRLLGRIWAGLMWGNAIITLFFNAGSRQAGGVFVGDWSPIHALSIFVAVMVPVAVMRARRHDRAGHESAMRGLVIGSLLVAGFFTLPFGRMLGTWLMGH